MLPPFHQLPEPDPAQRSRDPESVRTARESVV